MIMWEYTGPGYRKKNPSIMPISIFVGKSVI